MGTGQKFSPTGRPENFATLHFFKGTKYLFYILKNKSVYTVREGSVLIHNVVEASTTRGMTALVYCLINSSLYTGTVHRWWSTPNWLGGQ
jgi:hypothetical protein